MVKKLIGTITHFFPKVNAAVVKLESKLTKGDKILIEGEDESFEQCVDSMQIDREPIESAKKGEEVGLEVEQPVKPGYKVFKI